MYIILIKRKGRRTWDCLPETYTDRHKEQVETYAGQLAYNEDAAVVVRRVEDPE